MADEAVATKPDLDAVAKEVAALTDDEVRAQVLKIRTRQKLQQKRQSAKGGQKAYMVKAAAKRNALKERAIQLGIYDEVNKEADAAAEKEYEDELAEKDGGEENGEAAA